MGSGDKTDAVRWPLCGKSKVQTGPNHNNHMIPTAVGFYESWQVVLVGVGTALKQLIAKVNQLWKPYQWLNRWSKFHSMCCSGVCFLLWSSLVPVTNCLRDLISLAVSDVSDYWWGGESLFLVLAVVSWTFWNWKVTTNCCSEWAIQRWDVFFPLATPLPFSELQWIFLLRTVLSTLTSIHQVRSPMYAFSLHFSLEPVKLLECVDTISMCHL